MNRRVALFDLAQAHQAAQAAPQRFVSAYESGACKIEDLEFLRIVKAMRAYPFLVASPRHRSWISNAARSLEVLCKWH
jgi:hypothetical protein